MVQPASSPEVTPDPVAALAAGAAAYNRFLADLWGGRQGELERLLVDAAGDLAADEPRIQRVERVELTAAAPPRLDVEPAGEDRWRVRLSLPGDGGWSVFLRMRARLQSGSGSFHRVDAKVGRLRAVATMTVVHAPGSARVELLRSQVRVTVGEVDLDSSNLLLDLLVEVLEPVVKREIKKTVRRSLRREVPSRAGVRAVEELGLAGRPVELPAPPPAGRLRDAARSLDRRVRDEHLPFGTLLGVVLDGPAPSDAPETFIQFGDSAIWTGHYLAAQAFRHAATTDPEERRAAAEGAGRALEGLRRMLRVAGEPGLLSRVVVPADSPHAQTLRADARRRGQEERLFSGRVDGEETLSLGHVTRDQYAGAFLGTALAHHLLDESTVRQTAGELAVEMAAYLVERDFAPTEAVEDPELGFRRTSVTYLNAPAQVLAILQVAHRIDPQRFEPVWERVRPMASLLWLFGWLQTLDPHHRYFKFNLEHALMLVLLLLEGDGGQRAELASGLAVIRHALRHHANPWFDLVEIVADVALDGARPTAEVAAEVAPLLGQWLERPEILEAVDLTSDPAIERVAYRGPRAEEDAEPVPIARQPVPVPRRPTTDFLWQRSPFQLTNELDVFEDRAIRSPGVDFLLPYWMGRWAGVLAA